MENPKMHSREKVCVVVAYVNSDFMLYFVVCPSRLRGAFFLPFHNDSGAVHRFYFIAIFCKLFGYIVL